MVQHPLHRVNHHDTLGAVPQPGSDGQTIDTGEVRRPSSVVRRPSSVVRRPSGAWRKSSYSNNSNNCVELAETTDGIAMRNSRDPAGTVLHFDRTALQALIQAVKAGELDDLGSPTPPYS